MKEMKLSNPNIRCQDITLNYYMKSNEKFRLIKLTLKFKCNLKYESFNFYLIV